MSPGFWTSRPGELKLLIERREQFVGGRTREVNRIRWYLHALGPAQDPGPSAFNTAATRTRLRRWLDARAGIEVDKARMILDHIDQLCTLISALARRIGQTTIELAPADPLTLPACGR